jgi:tRNA modification GTPase
MLAPDGRAGELPTIVGVATGTPDGGVALVRVSGDAAFALVGAAFGLAPVPERRCVRRRLPLAGGGHDDALVVWMPGPRSFTGEDVVELAVHAGASNVRSVVDALLRAGAQAAGPGAFTWRALLHGRLTLDEAEGVAALVGARTEAALLQARRLAAGELGREVEELAARLAAVRVRLEAYLDFPEDVAAPEFRDDDATLEAIAATLRRWLRGFEAGRRARELPRVVIAGPVNAGKSSLFNALLGHERALVADVAGTTRDLLDAQARVEGRELGLVDTAGLRDALDVVERMGVARSHEAIAGADAVIWVEASDAADAAPYRAEVRAAALARGTAWFDVESKRDVGCRRPAWIGAAALVGDVESLRQALRAWMEEDREAAWIGLDRHRVAAELALARLEDARAALARPELALELVAVDLRAAQMELEAIGGVQAGGVVGEDTLRAVFAGFCIGK